MQRQFPALAALVLLLPVHAGAQDPAVAQDPQAMMAAYEAAQADASRPGDSDLDCEALEAEFTGIVNDPAFRARIEEAGAAAQQDMAAMQAAQAQVPARTAATIAASTVPGAAAAALSAEAADAQAKQVEAAQRVQSRALQGQQLTAFMPQMMRGQKILELGSAKGCEFSAGMNMGTDLSSGAVPAEAGPDR